MYIFNRIQEKTFSVRCMCTSLSVSESGYYKWKRNRSKPKAWQLLLKDIHKILDAYSDNDNYGVERMMIVLKQCGIKNHIQQ